MRGGETRVKERSWDETGGDETKLLHERRWDKESDEKKEQDSRKEDEMRVNETRWKEMR